MNAMLFSSNVLALSATTFLEGALSFTWTAISDGHLSRVSPMRVGSAAKDRYVLHHIEWRCASGSSRAALCGPVCHGLLEGKKKMLVESDKLTWLTQLRVEEGWVGLT